MRSRAIVAPTPSPAPAGIREMLDAAPVASTTTPCRQARVNR
jgi:hypothetical protein